jgi:histidinol-phosphatase
VSNPSDCSPWEPDLKLALELADAADAVTMGHYLSDDLDIQTKSDSSPVTLADKRAEQTIRSLLAQQRPQDGVWGEEFGDQSSTSRTWIVDPIDGTKNYLRGVPVWCTLIGLRVAQDLVVGVASAPAMGRRWWAASGGGAWTRDVDGQVRQIRSSTVSDLADASFSYSDEEFWQERGAYSGLRNLIQKSWRSRAYGDFLSHVLVAEGAVDIAAEPDLMPWDMAALIPIVTESGGTITDFAGGPPISGGCALSTNGHLHELVQMMLQSTPEGE